MKTQTPLYHFANDLKDLYLKTGDKDIEDLFIQTAQSSDADFISWLGQHSEVQNSMGNPAVYSALMALVDIRNSAGDTVNPGNLVTYMHTKGYLTYIPIFLSFEMLLGSEVGRVLSPFANILTALKPFSANEPEDANVVQKELQYILNEYEDTVNMYDDHVPAVKKKKLSRKERRVMLFKFLVIKFSKEVANGLEQVGESELAGQVTGGLLTRPNELIKILGIKELVMRIKFSKDIYREHLGKASSVDKDFDRIYDDIKNEIMLYSNLITKSELQKLRDEKNKQTDWASMISNEDFSVDPSSQPLNIEYDPNVWKNHTVLILTSFILSQLANSID